MNHHQRKVLHAIFAHPLNANLEMKDIVNALNGLGAEIDTKSKSRVGVTLNGTDKLAGVLGRLEQRRCRLEQPRDPRSMGLFRRLVREALAKIAVENGGPNLKQKMSAPL